MTHYFICNEYLKYQACINALIQKYYNYLLDLLHYFYTQSLFFSGQTCFPNKEMSETSQVVWRLFSQLSWMHIDSRCARAFSRLPWLPGGALFQLFGQHPPYVGGSKPILFKSGYILPSYHIFSWKSATLNVLLHLDSFQFIYWLCH